MAIIYAVIFEIAKKKRKKRRKKGKKKWQRYITIYGRALILARRAGGLPLRAISPLQPMR